MHGGFRVKEARKEDAVKSKVVARNGCNDVNANGVVESITPSSANCSNNTSQTTDITVVLHLC